MNKEKDVKRQIEEKKELPKFTKEEITKSDILRQTSIYEFIRKKNKKPKKKMFV